MTLAYYHDHRLSDSSRQAAAAQGLHQFIDVEAGADSTAEPRAQVALDLARIDHGTILATITMINQFKRLGVGRHEYGQPRPVEELVRA